MKRKIDVGLCISADEYLRLYKGQARDVVTTAHDGRTVRFPARILQRYVTREGTSRVRVADAFV